MNDAPTDARDHYSYTHYADMSVAEGFDALRFGGPIGRHLLKTQEHLLQQALAPLGGRRVLDVGTGTGRAAIGLALAGAEVIGADASAQMLDVARARAAAAHARVEFVPGDAHALPFPDGSFDAAVCLRVIMHTPNWSLCVDELCRVSRWRVVVDFPAALSAAALESTARRIGRALGRKTEAYRVLSEREVAAVLRRRGFRIVRVDRQFVIPIAIHKAIGSLPFTRAVERALSLIGFRRLFASPVTMVAER